MKNKKMGIVAVLVMLVAITLNSVGGTYAKYISKIDMTDEARVAKWHMDLTDGNGSGNYDLDLFDTSYFYNGTEYVKSLNSDNVVAPGTKGESSFEITAKSEVRYTMSYNFDAVRDFVVYYTTKTEGGKTVVDKMSNKEGELTGAKEYRPLTYWIEYKIDGTENADVKAVLNTTAGVKADMIQKAFDDYNANNGVGAGKHSFGPAAKANTTGEHKFAFNIKWEWDTTNTVTDLDATQVNRLDTFAGENLSDEKVEFKVGIVAEQVAEANDHATTSTPKTTRSTTATTRQTTQATKKAI